MILKKTKPKVKEASVCEKSIFVSHEIGETSVAIVEDGIVEEFYIERESKFKIYGNIYKGIVKAVVPGINAVFVDIGTGKDGFLYLDDLETQDDDAPRKQKSKKRAPLARKGDEVIVQVAKEAIRHKGPRLTTKLSIPARYLVLTSEGKQLGVSRRIADKGERERIKEILAQLPQAKDVGFIVRTVSEGKPKKDFMRDARYLIKVWNAINQKKKKVKAPGLIHKELGLVERIIRDTFTEDTAQICTDSEQVAKKIMRFLQVYIPGFRSRVKIHKEKSSLFAKYNIDKEIETTYEKKVLLKSGGDIVIEQTEGMTAIDVNSGKYKDKKNAEKTAFRINKEAAQEIIRQLRLRDIGGIIIIDFIDMEHGQHKKEVSRILHEAATRDKAKINILKISDIGVVEMTRQRIRASLESSIFENCSYCGGRGFIKSLPTMRIQVLKKLRQSVGNLQGKQIFVSLHSEVAEALLQSNQAQIKEIENINKNSIVILANPAMHREEIDISY